MNISVQMAKALALFFTGSSLLFSIAGYAQTTEKILSTSPIGLAVQIEEQFKSLPVPDKGDNPFTHWSYQLALSTAQQCLTSFLPNGRNYFFKTWTSSLSGSYRQLDTKTLNTVCHEFAQSGITPWCSEVINLSSYDGVIDASLQTEYLQFKTDLKSMTLHGDVECYLTTSKVGKQFYTGSFSGQWLTKSAWLVIPDRKQQLLRGNVLVREPYAKGTKGTGLEIVKPAFVFKAR